MPQDRSPDSKETTSQYEKLLAGLARNGVDFAIVGGLAVILNGYARVTLDADILIQHRPENIQRLIASLATWGEGSAAQLTSDDLPAEEGSTRITEDFPLDVFTRMRGKTLDDFRSRLRYFDSDGVRIAYLAAEDLIWLKQQSWREKDQMDVFALTEIMRGNREV